MLDIPRALRRIIDQLSKNAATLEELGQVDEAEGNLCLIEELKKEL